MNCCVYCDTVAVCVLIDVVCVIDESGAAIE